MRKKLVLLGFIVAATAVSSLTRPAEALVCNRSCCGADVCTCCHLGCLCPAPVHHA